MYARRQTRPKPRKSNLKSFPAPVAGWIANRALAVPNAEGLQQGAAVLDNFFPTATSVQLRRGKLRYAALGDGSLGVSSLFSYNNGDNKSLFAATQASIYDITTVPYSGSLRIVTDTGDPIVDAAGDYFGFSSAPIAPSLAGFGGGNWIVVQFATTGGVFLVGVNGVDDGFIYDGDAFYPYIAGGASSLSYDALVVPFIAGTLVTGGTSGATATIYRVNDNGDSTGALVLTGITGTFVDNETLTDSTGGTATANGVSSVVAPGITFPGGLTSADMSYVWVYKSRLWFAQVNSMDAYYMDAVDSIGGNPIIFPLAGIFGRGGTLLFGYNWSTDSSTDVSLSEQCIFVSDEGEVAVYQGADPADPETWGKVGTYRIGKPLGNRAFFKGGGDIAISTSVGLVPLSKAISLDLTALNTASVSYKISDAWTEALALRGSENWQAEVWPDQKIAVISPPFPQGTSQPVMFVANTDTGAWARYTGWHGLSLEVFEGKLYFGSGDGVVYIANQTGQDDGATYSGAVMPLFDDLGAPASLKVPTVGRAVVQASAKITDKVVFHADFDEVMPVAPNATPVAGAASIWDVGEWGSSVWDAELPAIISQDWRSLAGRGYATSISLQITSGALTPLDAELVRLDMMWTVGEAVT